MERGRIVGGRFRVEGHVGAGGMGSVFSAIDGADGSRVALKVLIRHDPEIARRFADEARLLAELRHPAIVRHVAHGTGSNGEAYLAMEWLDGEDLAARLCRGRLSIDETLDVARRAAVGLAVAHARGVVHRDVKPSNLFLCGGAVAETKLIDFGIARAPARMRLAETAHGLPIGTPAYMSPEQARAERAVDARADLFSLGCVLFECLTGRAPFVAEHVMAVLAKIVLEASPRVSELAPEVPRALDRLVARLMAKDPDERPPDAAALLAELDLLDARERTPPPQGLARSAPPPPAGPLGRRELALVGVIAAHPSRSSADDAFAATVAPLAVTPDVRDLRARLAAMGAVLEALADGSLVAVLEGRTDAKDLAVHAARCSLSFAEALPAGAVALAIGRGEVAGALPVGDAIDRAVHLLGRARRVGEAGRALLVDDVAAALLPPRFETARGPSGVELHAEGEGEDTARTLLGKPTPFVGREPELERLGGLFAESVARAAPRFALVTGAPGVGKSRVRHELTRVLARLETPPAIFACAADAGGATPPLGLVAGVLRRAFGVAPHHPPVRTRQRLRNRLGARLPPADAARVEEAFAPLVGLASAADAPPSTRLDPRLGADRLRRAWLDWLDAECAAQPVFISIEDLHAGDAPSATLFEAAIRELSRRPLFVVGFARPGAAAEFPKLALAAAASIELRPLSRAASVGLVRAALGDAITDATADVLAERAAGNAFHLEELVRLRAEGRKDDFPESVLAMAEARLAELDDEARRTARAASVFGTVFWRAGLAELLGCAPAALDARLALLVQRELVHRHRSSRVAGDVEYAFRHDLLREAAYALLVDADRALGHRLAAAWLETVPGVDARAIATHHDLGDTQERAVPWFVRAADEALGRNDLQGAIACAERGVACGASGHALGMLQLADAEARVWLGQFSEAERAATLALAELPPATPPWYAGVGVVVAAAATLGRVDDAGPLVAALVRSRPARAHAAVAAAAGARMASHLAVAARPEWVDRLAAWIDAAAALVDGLDPLTRGHLALATGMRALAAGDLGAFLAAMRRASAAFEEGGDVRRACSAQANVGFASSELGRYDEAERALRDALAAASRAGLPNAEGYARHNLGGVLARRGRLAEARAMEEAAIEAAAAQQDRRLETVSRIYLAQILLAGGELAAALAEARAAVGLATAAPMRAHANGVLASVLLAAGDAAGALVAARDAYAVVEELGGVDDGESVIRLAHAESLAALADPEAPRAFARARERVLARAKMIEDPALARGFLADVSENAAILARAAALAP